MNLEEKIKSIIEGEGLDYKEKARTIYTTCPSCGRSDKFSIYKTNGACVCYREGSCDFGKRFFHHWLAMTANIPLQQAREIVYGSSRRHSEELNVNLDDEKDKKEEDLEPVLWPPPGFLAIDAPESGPGAEYLAGRGVSMDLAKLYDIRYCDMIRRVVLPIIRNGKCYGWQARAIDKVDSGSRMRNNTGFRREKVLMFGDSLDRTDPLILLEGPFDALKFHGKGGILCTMGKNISSRQVELINESPARTVYLGLDADADREMIELSKKLDKQVKVLYVPDSCIKRCKMEGKKADFGECTQAEIDEAINSAVDAGSYIFIDL